MARSTVVNQRRQACDATLPTDPNMGLRTDRIHIRYRYGFMMWRPWERPETRGARRRRVCSKKTDPFHPHPWSRCAAQPGPQSARHSHCLCTEEICCRSVTVDENVQGVRVRTVRTCNGDCENSQRADESEQH